MLILLFLSFLIALDSLNVDSFIILKNIKKFYYSDQNRFSKHYKLHSEDEDTAHWYKIPKEYQNLTNADGSPNNSLITPEELKELGIDDTECSLTSHEEQRFSHPIDNIPLSTRSQTDSELVEDIYYTDIVMTSKEKGNEPLDPFVDFEKETLDNFVASKSDSDSIEECILESNRVIETPTTTNDEETKQNNYLDKTFPQVDFIPPKNYTTGQYLIDRHLIQKVATLRTCIEIIEKGIDKKDINIENKENNPLLNIFCCFNSAQMKVFKKLVLDEGLFEEVVGRALAIYERTDDQKAFERITWISTNLTPWVIQIRKDSATQKLSNLISAALSDVNNTDLRENNSFMKLLWDYSSKGLLDKYLIKRFEEAISEAGKKYRIDDYNVSISEIFLTNIKNQIIAQMITCLNGTDLNVKTLCECLNTKREDWKNIVKCNINSLEGTEEFIEWLNTGAEFLSRSEKPGKVVTAENLLEIVDELRDSDYRLQF